MLKEITEISVSFISLVLWKSQVGVSEKENRERQNRGRRNKNQLPTVE